MKKQYGFTLVEIMVVLGILALLVFAASPLTGAWVNDAHLAQTEGSLKQAIGRAKAIALRNEQGITSDNAAAALCITEADGERVLSVLEGVDNDSPSCTGPTGSVSWSTQLSQRIDINTENDSPASCVCFDNKALITASGDCSACTESTTFLLIGGSRNEAEPVSIY